MSSHMSQQVPFGRVREMTRDVGGFRGVCSLAPPLFPSSSPSLPVPPHIPPLPPTSPPTNPNEPLPP